VSHNLFIRVTYVQSLSSISGSSFDTRNTLQHTATHCKTLQHALAYFRCLLVCCGRSCQNDVV